MGATSQVTAEDGQTRVTQGEVVSITTLRPTGRRLVAASRPRRLDRTRAYSARLAKAAGRKTWHHTTHSHRYLWWVFLNTLTGLAESAKALVDWLVNGRRLVIAKRAAVEMSAKTASKEEAKLGLSRALRFATVFGTPLLAWVFLAFHFKIDGNWYGLNLGMEPAGYVLGGLVLFVVFLIGWSISGRPAPVTHAPRVRDNLAEDRLNEIFWELQLLREPKPDQPNQGSYLVFERLPAVTGKSTALTASFPANSGKKTAADVVLAREGIAKELGVAYDQLIVKEHLKESKARFTIKVLNESPWEGPPTVSPYINVACVNLWEESIRIGQQDEGEPLTIKLLWESVIIAGLPRHGKSNLGRVIFGALALDPYVDLAMLDGKGAADWTALEPIGTVVYSEARTGVNEAIAYLESVVVEIDRRMKILRRLPREVCPQSKVTPQIAIEYGMRPLALGVDELQEWFIKADKDQRDLLEEYLGSITRLGPAVGVMVIFMTQKPTADSKYGIPTSVRSNITTRIAVRCFDRASSDVVLGEGAAKRGLDASRLPEEEPGPALIWGQTGGGQFRADQLDPIDLDICVARGRELREEAGTLPGEGPGTGAVYEDEEVPEDVLEATAWVLRRVEGGEAQPSAILAALQDADPDFWEPVTPTSFGMKLSKAFKDSKINLADFGMHRGSAKVIKLAAVHAAVRGQGGKR